MEEAARRLAVDQRKTAITFVSLACSGAKVTDGLLQPYKGVEGHKSEPALEPQVDRLRTLRARNGGHLDAVMMIVGANDEFLGRVVRHCIAQSDCFRKSFNGGRADEVVGFALEDLIGRYERLAGALRGIVPSRAIVLVEYHDPTHGVDGKYCSHSGIQISHAELEWAHDGLLVPLNQRVAAAAPQRMATGWRRRPRLRHTRLLLARSLGPHPSCAATAQGCHAADLERLGTLHPSVHGQMAIANRVAPVLADVLRLEQPDHVAIPVADDRLTGIPEETDTVLELVLAWLVLGLLGAGGLSIGRGWRVLAVLGGAITFVVCFGPRLWRLLRPRGTPDVAAQQLAGAFAPEFAGQPGDRRVGIARAWRHPCGTGRRGHAVGPFPGCEDPRRTSARRRLAA